MDVRRSRRAARWVVPALSVAVAAAVAVGYRSPEVLARPAGGDAAAPLGPLVAADGVPAPAASRPPEGGAAGTPTAGRPGRWTERILDARGSVDPAAYRAVAGSYDRELDYRLGPTAADLGARGGSPATVAARGRDGWDGDCADVRAQRRSDYWFSMSGQLLHAPSGADTGAGSPAGVARARNGAIYRLDGKPCYDLRVSTEPDKGNHHNRRTDPAVTDEAVLAANGGTPLGTPVAVARARVGQGIDAVLAFANGMVVLTGTGNDRVRPAFARLPAGSVPTAAARTNHGEFALVSYWNTRTVTGGVAVFAVKGAPDSTDRPMEKHWGLQHYGLHASGLKLLGVVPLPGIAAPTAISAADDVSIGVPDRHDPAFQEDLAQQRVRDRWAGDVDRSHRVARAGYAVVASRAEGKVAFVDLQPLFGYYRSMYLTDQASYDRTTRQGPADGQWPHTFSAAPQQRPAVTAVLDVAAPTAVAAGFPRGSATHGWRGADTFGSRAYVAGLDGTLRVYDVGGLNTRDAARAPALVRTVDMGRNPTAIEYGRSAYHLNDLVVTSRGDRRVTILDQDGGTVLSLRDRRWSDPVAAFPSRYNSGAFGASLLTVADFAGHQVLNYSYGEDSARFGYATRFGESRPFAISFTEVW